MKIELRLILLARRHAALRSLLLLAGLLAFGAGLAQAQTVDEVIAKNIQAHGGLGRWQRGL